MDADLILVGGGLANSLIAWRLASTRPSVRVVLLEAGEVLGGNHTWSFHDTDLTPLQRAWIDPLVTHRWSAHDVLFPNFRRRLSGDYLSISSKSLHALVHRVIAPSVRFGAVVTDVQPTRVRLASGATLSAPAVIDARGPAHSPHLQVGFQKFLGQEVRTRVPHGLKFPVLMDATVDQHGGYRFVYVLPLAADVLLIEDTCYADDGAVDRQELRKRIAAYAVARRWDIVEVRREEEGVLPILLGGSIERFLRANEGVSRAGVAAALFHPTTGYSLPEAVTMADLVASQPDLGTGRLNGALETHCLKRWQAGAFFRMLNRMLFRAADPQQRRQVMARFYGLDAGLISRFYAARLTLRDKLQLVSGRPPVPLLPAMRAALDLMPRQPVAEVTA